jgi:hypothetical protein
MSSGKMPEYQSHKRVHALKIEAIEILEDGSAKIAPEKPFSVFTKDAEWAARFKGGEEDDPGYYVVYEDGYCSWSPTKAFEEGYSRV